MRRGTGILNKQPAPETPTEPLRDFLCIGIHYRVVEASYADDEAFDIKFMNMVEQRYVQSLYIISTGKRRALNMLGPSHVDPEQIKKIIEWDFR